MSGVLTPALPPMSDEQYVEYIGTKCPFCRSTQTTGGEVEIDDGVARQVVSCDYCDKEWTDSYSLTGYTPA